MKTKTRLDVQIRWMIRRDMPEVLAIETESFTWDQWTEEEFLVCLRQKNCIGMVAERRHGIIGYMIYELLKAQLHVLNFAVEPCCRLRGVGRQMIEKLKNKLSQQRRTELLFEVRDSNVEADLFLRSCGFQAVDVLKGFYDDVDEDAYQFSYLLGDIE